MFFERCKVVVLGAGMLAGWVGELMVVAHSEQASALHVARPQLVHCTMYSFLDISLHPQKVLLPLFDAAIAKKKDPHQNSHDTSENLHKVESEATSIVPCVSHIHQAEIIH